MILQDSSPSSYPACGRVRSAGAGLPRLLACALALMLAACGGGGDTAPGAIPGLNSGGPVGTAPVDPGTPAPAPAPAIGLTLAIAAADSTASTTLALGKPLRVTATVLDGAGKPVANALLSVAVDAGLVAMTPARGQVATDADGKASVSLAPAGVTESGATAVRVTAQYNGLSASAESVLTVAQPALSLRRVAPQASPAPLPALGSALVVLDVYNDGVLLSGVPVTLALRSACADAGRAALPGSVTTVQGRAQFTYRDQSCAQGDSIVATVEGTGASATVVLSAASPDAASIVVGSIVPATNSIVIQGAGGNGRTETAQVGFRVLDKNGAPLPNQGVSFSTISTGAVRLSQTYGITDANGDVFVNLVSGTEPTAVRVAARLANGMSTVSDTITVTTGLPTQLAFSLSAEKFNIEGFDYDDVGSEVKLLLADVAGNPVADGVPVVTQTDSGAIGSSARGGCVTVNGRCTVDLRSQNPRYGTDETAPRGRAGLATITVTTLAASNVALSGEVAVFLSGSHAGHYTLESAPAGVTLSGNRLTIDTAGCSAVNVSLRISDARRNPMPAGSALTFESPVLLVGNAYPGKVPSIAPVYTRGVVGGDQGSVHTLALLPDPATCEVGGPRAITGAANMVLTTPLGNTSLLPVTVRYQGKAETAPGG